MGVDMQRTKDFLAITDFSESEIRETFRLAADLKRKKGQTLDVLNGRTVACIFRSGDPAAGRPFAVYNR
jgi:ornithine carbamoyltransferase